MSKGVIVFALFLLVAIVSAEVIQLNPDNIKQVLTDNDSRGILVKFYAPWCGHCKSLAPEYEAAAELLPAGGPVLAEADCDAHRSIGEEYQIQGYPTLKFFKDGDVIAYNGGRSRNEIVSWLKKNTLKELPVVASAEDLKPSETAYGKVVLFGTSDKHHADLLRGSKSIDDIEFGQVVDQALITSEKANSGLIRLYKKDGTTYDFPADTTEILTAVESVIYPKVVEFSQAQFQRLSSSKEIIVFGFAPYDNEEKLTELKTLLETSADANSNVGFVFGDSVVFARGLSGAGASGNVFPTVVAIRAGSGQFVWDEETPLNSDTLNVWIKQVFEGNPPTNKKSEPLPESNDGPVVKLVYKNYNEYFSKQTPIFVKYYAPWCGHCKNMAADWVQLGEAFNKKDVIIAEYDATANYAEVENIEGFPTLVFYDGKGGKEVYDGARTFDALKSFVSSKLHGSHAHDEL